MSMTWPWEITALLAVLAVFTLAEFLIPLRGSRTEDPEGQR